MLSLRWSPQNPGTLTWTFSLFPMQLPALKILAASVILKSHLCTLSSVGPLSSAWTLTGCTVVQGAPPRADPRRSRGSLNVFLFSWGSQSCPAFDTVLKMVASCILRSFMVGYDRGADPVPVNCAVTRYKELTILPQAFFPYVLHLRTTHPLLQNRILGVILAATPFITLFGGPINPYWPL